MKQAPQWLDRQEYPFSPHFFAAKAGRMHYIDEGSGYPIVFVHGNPSWSFAFRNVIKKLAQNYRCIASDLIGFGLSDKPTDWTYLPQEQAQNLAELLDSLNLMDITFVVEDWGGPIGLSYALNHPERCRNLVITNTWLWSVRHDWHFQAFSKFVGGAIGRFLIKKRNFFARDLLKAGFADKKKLTEKIHNHYLMPLAKPCARKGNWTFPKQIVAASEWLASLWQRRHILQQHNVLLAWGMKDLAFRPKELNKWIEALPHARVVPFPEAGHFVAEEKPEELGREIEALLAGAFYS